RGRKSYPRGTSGNVSDGYQQRRTVTSVGSGLGLAGGLITGSGTKVALLGSPCADTVRVTTRTKSTDRMSIDETRFTCPSRLARTLARTRSLLYIAKAGWAKCIARATRT